LALNAEHRDASSQEESILGGFLEGFTVFICKKAYRTHGKSTTTGLDLEFDKDRNRCVVAIKSGPSWGNSGQIAQMRTNFKTAVKVYRQNKDAQVEQSIRETVFQLLKQMQQEPVPANVSGWLEGSFSRFSVLEKQKA
jgi:hypothetical protein